MPTQTPINFLDFAQFHLQELKVPEAWDYLEQNVHTNKRYGSLDVVIAVNDTGVESITDPNVSALEVPDKQVAVHPDLNTKVVDISGNKFQKFIHFYSFEKGVNKIQTFHPGRNRDHGIACTSVIAASPDLSSKVKPASSTIVQIGDPPARGADIISVSILLKTNEKETKEFADTLTSYGRNGRGVLIFVAVGNGGDNFDLSGLQTVLPKIRGELSNQPALINPKLIGIGSLTKIISGNKLRKSDHSNDANENLDGLEFTIPDVIRKVEGGNIDDESYPSAASITGRGAIIGNVDTVYRTRLLTTANIGDQSITIEHVDNINIGHRIKIGERGDLDFSDRKDFVTEERVINAPPSGNTISFSPALNNKYNSGTTISINNHFSNPGIITQLTGNVSIGDSSVTVNDPNGFDKQQKIQIDISGSDSDEEPTITNSYTQGQNPIPFSPNLTYNHLTNTFISVQRRLVSANGNVLTLTDVTGMNTDMAIIVGEPSSPNSEVRIITNVSTANRQITVINGQNGSTNNALQNAQPGTVITIHRYITSVVGAQPSDKIIVSDASGLTEEMTIIIGPLKNYVIGTIPSNTNNPNTVSPRPHKIKHIDYTTNKLTLYESIQAIPDGPHKTILIAGEVDYVSDFVGTSFSTPVTAGIAGLILSTKPSLSWLEVRDIMRKTVQKIDFPSANYRNSNDEEKKAGWVKDRNEKNPVNRQTETDIHNKYSYSRWYGYGMPNALDAVTEANGYDHNERDLMIRDFLNTNNNTVDDGVAATNPSAIDSPDIWVRHIEPSIESFNAIPGGTSNLVFGDYTLPGSIKHQNPFLGSDKWIYVRIGNRGVSSDLKSLEGTEIIVSVTFTNKLTNTNDPLDPELFKFPETWMNQTKDLSLNNYEETFFLTPIKGIDPLNYKSLQSNYDPDGNQHMIPPIAGKNNPSAPNEFIIRKIPWSKKIKPSITNVLNLRVYIKVQITPFDGIFPGINNGKYVHENNNLSFKPVAIIPVGFNK
ncbi:MAG: S8 family serine peptidase [Bacteroidetes bacterium]|nr:S8 family serine peptidase [Bacteroidota bacterium]